MIFMPMDHFNLNFPSLRLTDGNFVSNIVKSHYDTSFVVFGGMEK